MLIRYRCAKSMSEKRSGNHPEAPWHTLKPEEALAKLGSTRDGLSEEEAQRRLQQYGRNKIQRGREVNPWAILLHQVASPLIYILLAALAVTLAIGNWADSIVIAVVVVLNTVIGFFQEYRAENAMQALLNLVTPKATVLRGGGEQEIDSADLVPGDVVQIEEGRVVPADLRVLESARLQVDESVLTGESVPSAKWSEPLEQDIELADRENMAYMSTAVTSGRGIGLVVATGRLTEVGSIAEEIQTTSRAESPLQTRMKRFARLIAVAVVGVSAVAFAVGVAFGEPLRDMFLTAVSLAVSAVPEGLPVVMSIALAVTLQRMAKRRAIVRRLPAVETLGSCTIILSDKTGTLTRNEMTVQSVWTAGSRFQVEGAAGDAAGAITSNGETVEVQEDTPLYLTLLGGVLANAAFVSREDGELQASGDPTEVALLVSGMKAGLKRESLLQQYPLVDEVPFDPRRRFSATVHRRNGEPVVMVKGAPERIVEMCDSWLTAEGGQELDRQAILTEAEDMAGQGLRVLAMAMGEGKDLTEEVREGADPRGLVLLGLQGMMDPPRQEAVEAVAACHRAGIRVAMVTGDNPVTARAIAKQVGIAEKDAEVRTGMQLEKMSPEELAETAERVSVYARVSPSQKLRLVNTLRKQGQIVAVTGDGVNDAPALKSAHIGAAMGQSGTDVAREASEMVLTDDNFATIYEAVEEGRTSFSNIRKATFFLISSGIGEVFVILGSLALRLPLPLLPAQILWLNVVTNGIVDVTLAFEPGEQEQYRRPPRDPREGILSRLLIERSVLVGLLMAAGTLGIFVWERNTGAGLGYARTAALTTLVIFQMFHVFNSRSVYRSVFRKNPLSNRFLLVGTVVSAGVHVAALYWGATQYLLRIEPLGPDTWLKVVLVAVTVIVVVELHKVLRRERD